MIHWLKKKKKAKALKANSSINSLTEITLMSVTQLCCYIHPIQTQVMLNTTLLLVQTVNQHVLIAYRIIIRLRVKTTRKRQKVPIPLYTEIISSHNLQFLYT